MDVLRILNLGLRAFDETRALQKELQKSLLAGSGQETLVLCQHPACITLGKSVHYENILVSREDLKRKNIEVFETERGGDITFHGPGQLVLYPIINLATKKKDVHWYMRTLEEVIIRTLEAYEIQGIRIPGRTGVWTAAQDHVIPSRPRKIGSLGVRISRWCTMHGLSLNVRDMREGFSLIHPCGLQDAEVISVDEIKGEKLDIDKVGTVLLNSFLDVFEYPVSPSTCSSIAALATASFENQQ